MRCNFWVAKIHILVYIDPLVRQSHEKLKLAKRRQLWSENHATSCKNFVVKNFTPEMCFVPKFQQNRINGSKVKSRKPVFGLFLSHLWPWWPLSLGTGQMWVFAYRNAFLLEFWQSDHWFLRNVRSANCLGHTVCALSFKKTYNVMIETFLDKTRNGIFFFISLELNLNLSFIVLKENYEIRLWEGTQSPARWE